MKYGKVGLSPSLVEELNRYGSSRRPFVASLSYDGSESFCQPLDKLDETIGIAFPSYTWNCEQHGKPIECSLRHNPIPYAQYQSAFQKVQYHLHRGDTYLTNLTCRTPIETKASLRTIFEQSSAKYRLWIDGRFTFFSPESFVQIGKEGDIRTYPMKGTIDANVPNAEALLLESKKEREEHATVVDLLRNDLSMVAEEVRVPRFRFVETLSTNRGELLQVSSEVVGQLEEDWHAHLGDIFHKLLPAGSITGAPKPQTVEIIESCEREKRGFYTGVTLLYDGETLDSCVNIRFIEACDEMLYYHSGGGITSQSVCDDEYHEMERKIYVPTT